MLKAASEIGQAISRAEGKQTFVHIGVLFVREIRVTLWALR